MTKITAISTAALIVLIVKEGFAKNTLGSAIAIAIDEENSKIAIIPVAIIGVTVFYFRSTITTN